MNTIRVRDGRAVFKCPGCNETHEVNVLGEQSPHWLWTGGLIKPTFRPSIFVKTIKLTAANREAYESLSPLQIKGSIEDDRFKWWCHSFVTDGMIEFLPDSSHKLAGQRVPLPEWPGLA